MATWHFRASLLPFLELQKKCGGTPDSLPVDVFDSHDWWVHTKKNIIITCLKEQFGDPRLIGERMSNWSLGPHSITLFWDEKDDVRLVTSKVDARERCERFLEMLVQVAKSLNCVLYVSSLDIVPPDLSRLNAALKRSLAYRFLIDPKEALKNPIHLEIERIPPVKPKTDGMRGQVT